MCPCPKSKLLVLSSNFFSATQRTVELRPRADIHRGMPEKTLHAWLKLVTCGVTCDRMPEPLVKGDCKKKVKHVRLYGNMGGQSHISQLGIVPTNQKHKGMQGWIEQLPG